MAKKKIYIILMVMLMAPLLFFGGKRIGLFSQGIVNTVTSYALYPFLRVQFFVVNPIKKLVGRMQRISELEALVQKLGQEKEDLIAHDIALQGSLQFMDDARELVDFNRRYKGFRKSFAQIILKQFSDQGHYCIIDIGSRHGAAVDMVAVYKNCLIGRVSEVFPLFSKVVLITDRSCKVAAFCADTKTKGIYEGMNNEQMVALGHVSHLKPLKKNELVISSGQGMVFPRGFGLGRISYFTADGVNYTIRLSPLLDLKTLDYCYLLQKGEEKI